MKDIIEKYIDWNALDKDMNQNLSLDIKEALLKKGTRVLTIKLALNFVLPLENEQKLTSVIKNAAEQLEDVFFEYEYEPILQSPEFAIKYFVPHMVRMINGDYPGLKENILQEDVSLDGNEVYIGANGAVMARSLQDTIGGRFASYIHDKLGFEYKVTFVNKNDMKDQIAALEKSIEEKVNQYASEKLEEGRIAKEALEAERQRRIAAGEDTSDLDNPGQTSRKGKGKYPGRKTDYTAIRKAKELPVKGNVIMGGKPIKEEPIPIGEVNSNMKNVVTSGIVFQVVDKDFSGRHMVTIYLTDKVKSLRTKTFVSEGKAAEIDKHVKVGSYITIKGQPKLDPYEKYELVVWVDAIEKGETPIKLDPYEGDKRVELHCHTKMSSMDGLNDVKTIIDSAVTWGQPAVAITDHGVVQSFPDASSIAAKYAKDGNPIKIIYGMEGYVFDDSDCMRDDGTIDHKKNDTYHIILLAKNQTGITNLYRLVSMSHLYYFYKRPRLPKSLIQKYREGLIIGAACEAGEVFQSILNDEPQEVLDAKAAFYDYLEIQPLINNQFLIDRGIAETKEDLREYNRRVVACADRLGKPVCATTDAHYDLPESAIYRNAILGSRGFKDAENGQGLYLRTTQEMLDEFSYFGEELAHKFVVENTRLIADMISEDVKPIPDGRYPPVIEGSDETLRTGCITKAKEIYGDPLPDVIEKRLMTELNSIITNNYSVMYVSAKMVVDKSMEDGYLVGSRGSVGSSFAATMLGITEVNPLDAHYICPECKYLEWGDRTTYGVGLDMPPKNCPRCGAPLKRDGFTIPFATFLGFDGDKEPDIDLNFAGEYQARAHKYVADIFGAKNIFKAGEVSALKEKTAMRTVKKYEEKTGVVLDSLEEIRIAAGCEGVKSTTGQHPGGIIIIPDDREIFEFCPVQHPANKDVDIITTHYDFHKLDETLFKLDMLGHTGPTILKDLKDMTGVDPLTVDITDEKILSIFNSIDALGIENSEYKYGDGTFAIPEFGTALTRDKLQEIKPSSIADLVRISGFSHGTGIWEGNAQFLVKEGIATMNEVIACRDDIMNYLIDMGLENETAFRIMELVRKGKEPLREDQKAVMREHNVPEWYIESCDRIQYMFPRAHAAAYVMTSLRMGWYKIYYPREFYAAFFSSSVDAFDANTILKGGWACLDAIRRIEGTGEWDPDYERKEKDKKLKPVYETAYEMYSRGYSFMVPKLGESHALKFRVCEGKVLLPFVALENVGEQAAKSLAAAYENKPFHTIEDAVTRAKINKSAVESLKLFGVFKDLPETDQISFFNMDQFTS